MHVAQAAHLAVDQVFAFARAIEPTRDLDVARERLDDLGKPDMSVAVSMTVAVAMAVVPVAMAIAVSWALFGRRLGWRLKFAQRRHRNVRNTGVRGRLRRQGQAGQPKAHFSGRARLARVAAAEDHVLHLVAAQALGALLAKHPRDGVGDVALAAAIRPDDGGDALVERKLGAVGEGLEPGDLEAFEAHTLVT